MDYFISSSMFKESKISNYVLNDSKNKLCHLRWSNYYGSYLPGDICLNKAQIYTHNMLSTVYWIFQPYTNSYVLYNI